MTITFDTVRAIMQIAKSLSSINPTQRLAQSTQIRALAFAQLFARGRASG